MTSRASDSTESGRPCAHGLRSLQVWVPDERSESFATEARRQSALVASAARQTDDMLFTESISAAWGE
ncbi:MAG: antitoxin MazE-like protein [Microcella pacifica]